MIHPSICINCYIPVADLYETADQGGVATELHREQVVQSVVRDYILKETHHPFELHG